VRAWWLASALILAALPGETANVEVHVSGDRVDLKTPGAQLSEVLTRLSGALGFKLTREDGVADPYLPALELKNRTEVEAVLGVLDGQGLNYVITMDASGATVESLLLTATKPTADAPSTARPLLPPGLPGSARFPRMPTQPPEPSDDSNAAEPPDFTPPDEEPPAAPAAPEAPPSPAATPPGPRPIRLPQPFSS
jgi:hypothetical protein